jgi:tRNA threonylcarbamoyladenosine biosynthesis protein TsaB
MNILAIDTATDIISAALGDGEKTWYIEADGGLHHSELLPGLIDRLLETAGLPKSAIQGLACMQGPGSFTGLRIAFSTVKGLALALGLPMVSMPHPASWDCLCVRFL